MNWRLFLVITVVIASGIPGQTQTLFTFVHDLLQDNIAGTPLVHKRTDWDFDPEVGKKRRVQFEALHGWQGRDLIARMGNGIADNGVTPKTSQVNLPAVILSDLPPTI